MLNKKIIECNELPIDIVNDAQYVILQQNPNEYSHSYFKYPCKFIPEIPRWFLKKYINKNDIILDPFSGSGTTVLESSIRGIKSVGIEISKLSQLLAKVKTYKLNQEEIIIINNFVDSLNKDIEIKYPEIENLNHWFDKDNINKLSIIRANIKEIKNNHVVDFLNVCFISIIRKCSKADNVSPKPYVSKKIKKKICEPYIEFDKTINQYVDLNKKLNEIKYKNNMSEIIIGNATDFNLNNKFSGAITSPPYINAFDYVRILRLETLWLELADENELREIKKKHVGTENLVIKTFDEYQILEYSVLLKEYYEKIKIIDNKRAHIILKFFNDMKKNLQMVNNHLEDAGVYSIVIGNSNIRGIEIESWKVISQISKYCGFIEELHFSYQIRNHYLRIDRKTKGGKINSDHILVLRKISGTKK